VGWRTWVATALNASFFFPIHWTGRGAFLKAVVLIKYLDYHFPWEHWSGKRVLEVGAGCGLVGLGLSLQGAEVVLTDREEVVPALAENVRRNIGQLEVSKASPLFEYMMQQGSSWGSIACLWRLAGLSSGACASKCSSA